MSAAVHAAINAVDAVCVEALGRRAAAEDHDEAVGLLKEVSTLPAGDRQQAARHFQSLLAVKYLAEYEDRLCDEAEAEQALRHLERGLTALRKGFPAGSGGAK